MAEIGIIEKFHAFHGSKLHEHDFKVEIIFEGKIDMETGFTQGIDHYQVIDEVKKIISTLKNKNLRDVLLNSGYKSSSIELIATYFLKQLANTFPIKCVKIWEIEDRYAIVYTKEI
jgi:6-pyruvoyl-tetrahydropterin synthase